MHAFERFQVVNGFQMRSFCDSLHGSDQFSDKNPWNFDAWCKVLPERGQKRSGHENHDFLQSVTWTCSKREFSCIFVGYSSRILPSRCVGLRSQECRGGHLNLSRASLVCRAPVWLTLHLNDIFCFFFLWPGNCPCPVPFYIWIPRREAGQFEMYNLK